MADLLSILSQAGQSLNAHRGAAAVAAANVQNANTPGYARQRANLTTQSPASLENGYFIGRGVELSSVVQIRDRFVEGQLPRALGAQARSSTEAEALKAIQVLNPDQSSGLTVALADFYGAIRALSVNAGDTVLRQNFLDSANHLVATFQRSSVVLGDSLTGLNDRLPAIADQANALSQGIAQLNREIEEARGAGAEPNHLLDLRQRYQDELSQLTGATPLIDSKGSVSMLLPGGSPLVSGHHAASISTVLQADGDYAIQVGKTTGAGAATLLPKDALGGTILGILDAREGIRAASDQLDSFVFDFANAINAVNRAGFDRNGAPGGDVFAVGVTPGGSAASIRLDAAVAADPDLLAGASTAAGAPGNGDHFLVLLATEREPLASGQDPVRTLAGIVGAFGARTANATAAAAHDSALLEGLQEMRESASGVSIDDELIEMSKAQRAFDAVSMVIKVTEGMLDTLLKLK
ncbi:MAG TPA: flagellar hook-associated protein FlgK [Vulgatibacter sp.]|nr:flagellar hook-associated protein FlgK [Vulgatibacter sp.]